MATPSFTPAEVDALIPSLQHIFGQVYALMAELVTLRVALEDEGLPSAPDDLAGLPLPEPLEPLRRRYLTLIAEVAGQLRAVGERGGILKDLEVGLVDFPGVWLGRPVHLCWRYGEPVVGYYHGRDEGYGKRRALSAGRAAMLAGPRN